MGDAEVNCRALLNQAEAAYRQIAAEELTMARVRAFAERLRENRITIGDEPVPTFPKPYFVPTAHKPFMIRLIESLAECLEIVGQHVRRGETFGDRLLLPDRVAHLASL